MSKHKAIPKSKRELVYKKFNGHCAYCGCEIQYKDMQVDHINSVYSNLDYKQTMTEKEMYDLSNLFPSCRMCNFYKSNMSIEKFRERLTDTMMNNLRKNYGYRLAVKYGLVEEKTFTVKFYFEKQ